LKAIFVKRKKIEIYVGINLIQYLQYWISFVFLAASCENDQNPSEKEIQFAVF